MPMDGVSWPAFPWRYLGEWACVCVCQDSQPGCEPNLGPPEHPTVHVFRRQLPEQDSQINVTD